MRLVVSDRETGFKFRGKSPDKSSLFNFFKRDIESEGILKMDLNTIFVSCEHLMKWFCERERCQRLRSSPEKAREGRERNLFWLISRLQAPTEGGVSA